ncbi:MAG TPA: carotenoid oxygenase family protein [Streptomyces sp.]|uniref:carotenoid oxygenase family protein n=1 Tax=Streptomyces sp. TaxID=1931 RepID=UPI002CB341AB|nr:carotenoid oxygenase family protein [Streptomyces sp.]HWU08896.1 carotenoid oxygenase family protein [Streptomyces sp.]
MSTATPVEHQADPHLTGVFAPVVEEVDVPDVRVEGELPAELDGDYVRNGPNPRFAPIGAYVYPLDGDGMLHRVRIGDGRARYTNRFVRTPALVAEEAAGRALWPGITGLGLGPGAEVVGPELAHTTKDLPDINVVRHHGRLLALAESATPFLVSPELQTLGRETFCGTLPAGITAHPKIDPRTGEMVAFCYGVEEPYLTWSVIGPDGDTVRAATPIEEVDRPVMIHDMALTERFVVLVLAPFFFDIAGALRGGSPLSWEPDRGTRIALVPRDGSRVRWFHEESFWMWHTANAHERGGRVVLDYVQWTLPGGLVRGASTGSLSRLVLDLAAGTSTRTVLADRSMEFPRIDDRALTASHTVVAVSLRTAPGSVNDPDTLGWFDTGTGELAVWESPGLALGEQVFVPRPGDPDPGHGWWITYATDRAELTSRVLVLPAADPTAGPIARIHLPQRVPLGLHGSWLPAVVPT